MAEQKHDQMELLAKEYNYWILELYKKRIQARFFLGLQKSEEKWKTVWEKEITMLQGMKDIDEAIPFISKFPHGNIIEQDILCQIFTFSGNYEHPEYKLINYLSDYQEKPKDTEVCFDTMSHTYEGKLLFQMIPVLITNSSCTKMLVTNVIEAKKKYSVLFQSKWDFEEMEINTGIAFKDVYDYEQKQVQLEPYLELSSNWHTNQGLLGIYLQSYRWSDGFPLYNVFPLKWNNLCDMAWKKKEYRNKKRTEEMDKEKQEKKEFEQKMNDFMDSN